MFGFQSCKHNLKAVEEDLEQFTVQGLRVGHIVKSGKTDAAKVRFVPWFVGWFVCQQDY